MEQQGEIQNAKDQFLNLWMEGDRDRELAQHLADCYRRMRYLYLCDYFQTYVNRFGK